MGGVFEKPDTSDAQREAEKQRKQAQRTTQDANEEAAREKQRGERTTSGPRRGRDMLVGTLSQRLKSSLGA